LVASSLFLVVRRIGDSVCIGSYCLVSTLRHLISATFRLVFVGMRRIQRPQLEPWRKYYDKNAAASNSAASSVAARESCSNTADAAFVERHGGLRADAPVLCTTRRGSHRKLQSILSDPNKIAEARARFERQHFAATTRKPKVSRLRTFDKIARKVCGDNIFPLKPATLASVGGALKSAGYRTTGRYLSEAKLSHIESGHPWDDKVDRALRLSCRAAERGIGPPRKAAEIRLRFVACMTDQCEAVVKQGPLHPKRAWLVSLFWLLREIELAGVAVHSSHVHTDENSATLCLPASKTDTGGIGMKRTLRCICHVRALADDDVCGKAVCPVCAVKAQISFVCERFGINQNSPDALRVPLFPTKAGIAATKRANVASWISLYNSAGGRHVDLDGQIAGHSARRSGAKVLCRCGWELWKVQFHARWASDAVKGYTEEVFSEVARTWTLGT